MTAAARPVLSGPSRRKQCHVRLKLFVALVVHERHLQVTSVFKESLKTFHFLRPSPKECSENFFQIEISLFLLEIQAEQNCIKNSF